jgi:dynein heavy chain 2
MDNLSTVFSLVGLGSSDVRWNFVHGLFENAIYGGRVDNTYDLNVLKSYLQQYFEANVVTGGQVLCII